MILAIDIGNTNVKFGIYRDGVLQASFRCASVLTKTSDEYAVNVRNNFHAAGLDEKDVEGIVMSSVIPSLNYTFEHMCRYLFAKKPMIANAKSAKMQICYDNPSELGSDRIATSIAAHNKYGAPLIVVDFGTATTFNCIGENGEFLGGMIFVGMLAASEALVSAAAKLPRFELIVPEKTMGTNTVENLQAGMYYGFLGAVEHIVATLKTNPALASAKVVATGGLSELIAERKPEIFDIIDRQLSLYGLYLIYKGAAKE